MNTMNFAKGVGVGIVVGSAIGMAVASPQKKNGKKHVVSKALRTMSDIVENIGESMGM